MMDRHAGPCVDGGRHRWGDEVRRSHFPYRCVQRCIRPGCFRTRVIEYTLRGNHIAGYEGCRPLPQPTDSSGGKP